MQDQLLLHAEPPHKATTETTKAQKKPGKKSNTAPATIDDWGCNLFAGRQSGASEEAMLLMPLPQCMNQRVKLFALLSAVVLWLKFRCIQVLFRIPLHQQCLETVLPSFLECEITSEAVSVM